MVRSYCLHIIFGYILPVLCSFCLVIVLCAFFARKIHPSLYFSTSFCSLAPVQGQRLCSHCSNISKQCLGANKQCNLAQWLVLIKRKMNFCREAFALLKRRANQLFTGPDHLPQASPYQINSPPASSAVESESTLVDQDQQLQNESIPIPPAVEVAPPQNLDWHLVLIGFRLASAVDIALHSIQTNAQIPLCLQFLSFSILLAFASLFVARSVTRHHPMLPKVLEQAGVFFAVTAFFIAMTTSFSPCLKLISWAIYFLSFLSIIIFHGP